MKDLFLVYETITNGYISDILDIISLFAIFSGILVIISKNPIVSVLFLIGLFASIATYLIILGLSFIGLSYLIVYIGAVSILFLFILMLINIRTSELQNNTNNSIVLAFIITISFSIPLFQILPYSIAILNSNYWINIKLYNIYFNIYNLKNYYNNDLSFVTSSIWDGNLGENNSITAIGNIMYTNYNLWLIIASFILLLSMTGAIIITIRSKN